MDNIKQEIKSILGRSKTVLLFTGDAGSVLLLNFVEGMDVKVVFTDTGYHFKNICDYVHNYGGNIEIIKNENAFVSYEDDMVECCKQRKVDILKEYLQNNNIDTLIVPFRDEEKHTGIEDSYLKGLDEIEIIRPLSSLSEKDTWMTINANRLPVTELYKKGYKFIDCKCCVTRFGRKSQNKAEQPDEVDRETVEKLKALGYM